MKDIAADGYFDCYEMLNHIYIMTVSISYETKVAKVVSYRGDDSFPCENIKLFDFAESFSGLDCEVRRKLCEILNDESLAEIMSAEAVKKFCFTVQTNHNIYSRYTIALYPDKHKGKIYMTVAVNEQTDNIITLKHKKNETNINLSDIYYVDYGNHSVEIHTVNGHMSFFSVSFSDVAERLLKHENFLRSYKNCIVNMDRIAYVSGDSFVLDNGVSIAIPKRRLKEIKKYYDDYCRMK